MRKIFGINSALVDHGKRQRMPIAIVSVDVTGADYPGRFAMWSFQHGISIFRASVTITYNGDNSSVAVFQEGLRINCSPLAENKDQKTVRRNMLRSPCKKLLQDECAKSPGVADIIYDPHADSLPEKE